MGQAEHRPKAWLHRCAVAEVTAQRSALLPLIYCRPLTEHPQRQAWLDWTYLPYTCASTGKRLQFQPWVFRECNITGVAARLQCYRHEFGSLYRVIMERTTNSLKDIICNRRTWIVWVNNRGLFQGRSIPRWGVAIVVKDKTLNFFGLRRLIM